MSSNIFELSRKAKTSLKELRDDTRNGNTLPSSWQQDEEFLGICFAEALLSVDFNDLDELIKLCERENISYEKALSMAYETLKLNFVNVTPEMEVFVENELTRMRVVGMNKKPQEPGTDYATLRIELICVMYNGLDKMEDLEFLYVIGYIAQSIFVLKNLTKRKLPWDQMEFLIVHYVAFQIKENESKLFPSITKDKLLIHLKAFMDELNQPPIKTTSSRKKCTPKEIKEINSEIEKLIQDYQNIKDIFSLQKMMSYLKILPDPSSQGIVRILHVIGEYVKGTDESPHLSAAVAESLLGMFHGESRVRLSNLRDGLKNTYFLPVWDKVSDAKANLISDLQNLRTAVEFMLIDKKFETVRKVLNEIRTDEDSWLNSRDDYLHFLRNAELDDDMKKVKSMVAKVEESVIEIQKQVHTLPIEKERQEAIEEKLNYFKEVAKKSHDDTAVKPKIEELVNYIQKQNKTQGGIANCCDKVLKAVAKIDFKTATKDLLSDLDTIYEEVERKPKVCSDFQSSVSRLKTHAAFISLKLESVEKLKNDIETSKNEFSKNGRKNLFKYIGREYNSKIAAETENFYELISGFKTFPNCHEINKLQGKMVCVVVESCIFNQSTKCSKNKCAHSENIKKVLKSYLNKYIWLFDAIKALWDGKEYDGKPAFNKVKEFLQSLFKEQPLTLIKTINRLQNPVNQNNVDENCLEALRDMHSQCSANSRRNEADYIYDFISKQENRQEQMVKNEQLLYDNLRREFNQKRIYTEHCQVVHTLDRYSPTLMGKQLLNHLAHLNPLYDSLLHTNTSIAVVSNSIRLNANMIGYFPPPAEQFENISARNQQCLKIQVKMFATASKTRQQSVGTKIEDLRKQGAQLLGRNPQQCNILHYAAKYKNEHVFEYLKTKEQEIYKRLVLQKNCKGLTPLNFAAAAGAESIIEKYGAEFLDTEKQTITDSASAYNQKVVLEAIHRLQLN